MRAAKSAHEETVTLDRQTALTAFAEVEDTLAAQRLLADQCDRELAALASARKQLQIADNRCRAGLVGYVDVSTAQTAVRDQGQTVARLRGQRFAAAVALVKSLGGGWAGRPLPWNHRNKALSRNNKPPF